MFTGIVQDIGEIVSIDKQGDWMLTIAARKLQLDKMAIGASVACSGICLTVIEKLLASQSRASNCDQFKVQVSGETLSRTTAFHWRSGTRINLETALRMGDELGGHIVSGHVDGVAKVIEKNKEMNSIRYMFEVPHEFAKFIASKGSIALDGVSMTVNEAEGPRFGVNVIPHSQNESILGALEVGGEVNFEVDLIARYTERIMQKSI